MKYIVTRTSQWEIHPDDPPCEEAVLENLEGDNGMELMWTVNIDNLFDFFNKHTRGILRGHEDIIITDSEIKGVPIKIEFYDSFRE